MKIRDLLAPHVEYEVQIYRRSPFEYLLYEMKCRAARENYYHRRHVERWERRYGKPYPEQMPRRF